MEKNKKLIVLGVLALILIISGITYAILTWTSSRVNIGLTSNCFTIDYTKGNDIANASIKALNESDLISDNKFTIKEGIALTYANIGIKSTCTIEGYGSLYLNVTTLSSAFSTGNSKGALKYAVLDNTSTTSTVTVASLLNQQFNIVSKGSITSTGKITLLTKQLSNTKLNKYLIVIYADVSKIANDAMDASFNGTVSADANQGKAPITPEDQLVNLGLSVSSGTPNFTKTSIDDKTNGIYSAKDDLGTSYYFRGNVTNNYVKFANKYWRIIRINGDGTIRMIYAGTSAHANGYDDSSTDDMSIGTSAFNSSYNDNTYVGYMYGTAGASTYANTHSNTTNSTIKTKLDSWYDTNIVNTGNEKYIADAIYCNDRSVSSGTGIGTTNTTYAARTRGNNGQPTLKCANNNDKFTKSTTIGNGKLTKMIGLITSDEVIYAGGKSGTYNQEYYLYSGAWYWTMAPYSYASGRARVNSVYRNGLLDNPSVNSDGGGVRPVVSLKSDAISGGSGTAASPFLVG